MKVKIGSRDIISKLPGKFPYKVRQEVTINDAGYASLAKQNNVSSKDIKKFKRWEIEKIYDASDSVIVSSNFLEDSKVRVKLYSGKIKWNQVVGLWRK